LQVSDGGHGKRGIEPDVEALRGSLIT
jgi:hypothetical protein